MEVLLTESIEDITGEAGVVSVVETVKEGQTSEVAWLKVT